MSNCAPLSLGLVTCKLADINLLDGSEQLPRELVNVNIEPKVVFWEDGLPPRLSGLYLQSCWNAHEVHERNNPKLFIEWINEVEQGNSPLWNPPELVRWNFNKTYLLDLQNKGMIIPATSFFPHSLTEEPPSLPVIMSELQIEMAVIKPLISADAYETMLVSREYAHEPKYGEHLKKLVGSTGAMVQEFLPEIKTSGETSLVFINGEYSHAVLKKPGSDDFRVHEQYGGTVKLIESPPSWAINQASEILSNAPVKPLYARVDGILKDNQILVLEVEMVDPSLYFDIQPKAAKYFAETLRNLLCNS